MADHDGTGGTGAVLVTGAAAGIGAAVVDRFATSGHRVVALDRVESPAHDGDRVVAVVGDVRDPEVVERAVRACGGPIELVVNNAAVRPVGPAVEAELDQWRESVGVNLIAAGLVVAAAGPHLVDQRSSVVNIASGAAWGKRSLAVYGAAKAGLVSYSRTLATELAPRGIRVNVVVPGTTDTDMLTAARSSHTATTADDSAAPRNFGGRVLAAGAVAAQIELLVQMSWVTGAVVPVGLLPWEW